MGTDKVIFVGGGGGQWGATGSHVTGTEWGATGSHVTGTDVTGSRVTGRFLNRLYDLACSGVEY